jgi:surface antigen
MTPNLNTRARLKRAIRNNQRIYSAWESFRNFRWFTLAVIIILPIYPSLSVIGSDYEARAGDYDETTIITAYEGDAGGMEWSYINQSGLVSTDFDTVTRSAAKRPSMMTWAEDPALANEKAKTYLIATGDTLEKISARYGVSTDAILWANDLSPWDDLIAGNELRIPPISGVIYKVASGDTISEIARQYSVDADDIVTINNLKDAASIRKGMNLMIPGAAKKIVKADTPEKKNEKENIKNGDLKPLPTPTPSTKPTVLDTSTGLKSRYLVKYTGLSRWFAWWNCTWYVAANKSVSWRWNANAWMRNAKAAGVKTGQKPIAGAIIQFSGRGYNRYYGHVGIVADVTDDYVIIKDMNYRRLNEVTIRKVPKGDASIDGYIYVD